MLCLAAAGLGCLLCLPVVSRAAWQTTTIATATGTFQDVTITAGRDGSTAR